ncbi:MAG: hypothetical protein A3J24_10055 [Deltaproteobacteria bacterium RIFCSPLOWO2_02_FULL_53_8]|nr:MAG: hypothetical protein A3J24_10055 [Deltaproteobacteria bacterium RIFCSPLOWO2_02_FULL_53_8]
MVAIAHHLRDESANVLVGGAHSPNCDFSLRAIRSFSSFGLVMRGELNAKAPPFQAGLLRCDVEVIDLVKDQTPYDFPLSGGL